MNGYFITAITSDGKDSRCMGWYPTVEEAKTFLEGPNGGNIIECKYTYAVIEEIHSGIQRISAVEYWYEAPQPHYDWKSCDKPSWARGVCNWSIG